MAELNDKLITYGNLSTFYDKLQEQGTIENVSALPDANENKDKFYRLDNGDKDVYAAKLFSSETITTNRLPDEQQIDKAYLIDANPEVYKYEGDWTIVCTDGNVTLKCWNNDIEDDKAFFTVDNAETITSSSKIISVPLLDWTDVDLENKSLNADNTKSEVLELIENGNTLPTYELIPIPAIYNAPESAQIGNAYFNSSANIYTGEEYTFTYNGVTYNGYKWGNYYASSKPASEIYFKAPESEQVFVISDTIFYSIEDEETINLRTLYIPQLNAPDSEQVGNAKIHFNNYEYVYTGVEYTLKLSDNSIVTTGYLWKNTSSTDMDIYHGEIFTSILSENVYGVGQNVFCWVENDEGYITVSGTTVIFDSNEFSSIDFERLTSYMMYNPSLSGFELYQRTETTEEWGWEKVATEQYVDDVIGDKANKVDYTIPMTLDTETYEYVPDYSVLNSATTDGSYALKYVFTQSNVDTTVTYGNLVVSQSGMVQTIHYFNGMLKYTMRANMGGQWMALQEFVIPSIWQSNVSKDISTYSAEKVDELISALEQRIAALEGN